MSSIIDDKNKTIYVIKESVGGENKVSNIIEKLILKDIKVIAIAPNWVDTESTKEMSRDYLQQELKIS